MAAPPPDRTGERRDRDRDQDDAGDPSPAVLADDSFTDARSLVVGWYQQPRGAVGDRAGAAEERRDHEGDAHEHWVDVEVVSDPAADAGDHPTIGATDQMTGRRR